MITNVQPDVRYVKSYGNYDRAVKAADTLLEKLKDSLNQMRVNPRFVIVACGDAHNRFTPVFFNTDSTSIWFAQSEFTVVS